LSLALVSALGILALPVSAQAASIGKSAPGETPQIFQFEVQPGSNQAGGHSALNIWMRLCSTDFEETIAGMTVVQSRNITGASNTSPITITTEKPHGLVTGDFVAIQHVRGNTAANANQVRVHVLDATSFTLDGTSGNGTYEAGTGVASYAPRFGCTGQGIESNLLKDFVLSLAPGLLANPTAVIPCPRAEFIVSACPDSSTVGRSTALGTFFGGVSPPGAPRANPIPAPTSLHVIENIGPEPARLGTDLLPADPPGPLPVVISLRSTGDFGVDSAVDTLPTALGLPAKLFSIDTDLCSSAPCDPATLAPLPGARPFARNPTSCKPATSRLFARPYPPAPAGSSSHAESTFTPTGCDKVPFGEDVYPPVDPQRPRLDVKVTPVSKAAGAPTSTEVAIRYPNYEDDPIWQSQLKDVSVILPDGMSLAAGGGVGLESCSPEQFGKGNNEPVRCPEGSRIGNVRVDSPVLPDPLPGKAYLSVPTDGSGNFIPGSPTEASPWHLFIALEGQGVRVKLDGTVSLIPDPAHPGQSLIKNVFLNNPETPFTDFVLTTKGPDAVDPTNRGPAALANPSDCGTHTGQIHLVGYSGATLDRTPQVVPTENCSRPFAPQVATATAFPENAAANSISRLIITRPDDNKNIKRLNFSLPAGALGSLATAPRCPAAAARVGNCSDETKVGIIRNTVGFGSSNLTAAGSLYIGEPLEPGDAASFIIVVPAKVGPIDLGRVVVANRVRLRESDTGVDVLSGEIPTVLQGIPLPLQKIDILVNRENFFINPTGCDTRFFTATFFAEDGQQATSSAAAAAKNCDKVPFGPKLRIIAGARGYTKPNSFPPLKAIVTQRDGEANIKTARVVIPDILRPNVPRFQVLANLCNGDQLAAHNCPPGSVVGNARVRSPVLPFELSGPVYVVLERGAPLPKLAVFLRGGGFEIILIATNGFQGIQILNTFPAVPDAAQSYFELNINKGKTGALIAHDDLCKTRPLPRIDATFTAHSGKVIKTKPRLEADGCGVTASAARLTIVSRVVKVSRKGVAKVKLRCSSRKRCKGRLSLGRYGKKRFSIRGGKKKAVAVKLGRKARVSVRRAHRKKVKATARVTGGKRTSRKITLVAPKRR
jgi:hypothetical protein